MSETERAVFQVFIRGTIERVWEELTRTEGLQRAMFNSRMHVDRLAPGGQIRMRTPSGRFTSVAGRILEVTRPRRRAVADDDKSRPAAFAALTARAALGCPPEISPWPPLLPDPRSSA